MNIDLRSCVDLVWCYIFDLVEWLMWQICLACVRLPPGGQCLSDKGVCRNRTWSFLEWTSPSRVCALPRIVYMGVSQRTSRIRYQNSWYRERFIRKDRCPLMVYFPNPLDSNRIYRDMGIFNKVVDQITGQNTLRRTSCYEENMLLKANKLSGGVLLVLLV